MFCWQCGKEIYPGAFFCTNCGLKIRQSETPVQGEVGTAQNIPESAVQEQAGTVQMMQPISAVHSQEMMDQAQEPEPTVALQADNILASESPVAQMPFPAPVMSSETATLLNADVPTRPIVSDDGTNPGIGQQVSAPQMQTEVPQVQTAPQMQTKVPQVQTAPQMQTKVPQVQTAPQMQTEVPQVQTVPQEHASVIGAQGDPRKPKKGVIIAVIVAAILVFLVGVWGAFYFAEDSYKDYSLALGKREEVEERDEESREKALEEAHSYREDSEESESLELPEETEESKSNSEENLAEGMTEDRKEYSGEGMEDSFEEEGSTEMEETPWKNPKNGEEVFPGVPEVRPFSGRDVYPDIDGYAEGGVGDAMHTYWFDYTVTYAYVCSEYGGYIPSEGMELLVVEMAVKNTFEESIPMFDIDFQAQWEDSADDAFAWPLNGAEYLGGNVLPETYTLEKGQMVTGLLLFEVPAGYREFSVSYWEYFDDDSTGDIFFLYFTADRIQSNIFL